MEQDTRQGDAKGKENSIPVPKMFRGQITLVSTLHLGEICAASVLVLMCVCEFSVFVLLPHLNLCSS